MKLDECHHALQSVRAAPEKPPRSRGDITPAIGSNYRNARIEATVSFPIDGMRQAPISPVDGKPMKRANRDAVQKLIEAA